MFFAGVALAALAAAPAIAQPGGEGPGRFAQPQTRSAVQAQVQARFARADSNRDGFVTQDEVRVRAEARRAQSQERRGERRDQRFEQLDANNDGMISRAEFDSPRAIGGGERGERRAMRGERRGQRFAHRGGMRGGFAGRGFAAMDLDHDGRVALAEAQRAALQRFDRVDSNRDGTISPDERQAARAAMRERMQERPGD
jgi:Ca2+-binding EF-hand superfamily protein